MSQERINELETRVEQLESQLENQQQTMSEMLPSRRDALKALGGIGAAVVLGSAASGSASAGNASVGQIGTTSSPVDAVLEDVKDHNGNNPMSFPGDGSVNIDDVSIGPNSEIRFAADDAELDTKLSNAADGELIILGNAEFSTNRTVSNQLTFLGTSQTGPDISGTWTLNDTQIVLRGLGISGTIEMDNILCKIKGCNLFEASINVNADRCGVVNGCSDGAVTFASGTSGGLADSLIDTSVTDNGSNTVGDIG